MPRLRKLAECTDAGETTGKLPLIVHPDFARSALSVDLGRGTTVASPDALLGCAKANLVGASVAGLAHDNPRYSVLYTVTLGGSARPAPSSGHSNDEPLDATAQVVWEVALVRDAPKIGKIVARLPRGTQVRIGPAKDGWYPVQYGDAFAGDGWVFRGALGR